jgi:hypothetical protein
MFIVYFEQRYFHKILQKVTEKKEDCTGLVFEEVVGMYDLIS